MTEGAQELSPRNLPDPLVQAEALGLKRPERFGGGRIFSDEEVLEAVGETFSKQFEAGELKKPEADEKSYRLSGLSIGPVEHPYPSNLPDVPDGNATPVYDLRAPE